MSREERLEGILVHIRASGYSTMAELADVFEVSVRTIRRDVGLLRQRRFDLLGERGRGGGVSFARSAPLPVFESAFTKRLCLKFGYKDRHGKLTQREIEPHGILVQIPVWYILAVDRATGASRMFRMDRISAPACSEARFVADASIVADLTRDVPGLND